MIAGKAPRVGGTALSILLLLTSTQWIGGCGGTPTQDKNFYTSGNPEADQRATQRMAQAQQLKGQGGDSGNAKVATDKKPLYDRLGGKDGIAAITSDFVDRMLADPRVNFPRRGITRGGLSLHSDQSMQWDASDFNVKVLKAHMAEFLALAAGGPSEYQGKSMTDSHKNLHITNDEFDAAVGDLKATLDKLQIATTEQKELLAIVESTRGEIVEER